MRISMSKVMFTVLVVGLWSPDASAQVSKARPQFEYVKDRAERLNDLIDRRATEQAEILRCAKQLREVSISAKASLENAFKPLADAASGEQETRLKEPSKLAKELAILMGDKELVNLCNAVINRLETAPGNRPADFDNLLKNEMLSAVVRAKANAKEWEDLMKKSQDTLTFLLDNLRVARELREGSVKPGDVLNAAKKQHESKVNDKYLEWRTHHDAHEHYATREAEASRKCKEAVVAHDKVRAGPDAAAANLAYEERLKAEKAHQDAIKKTNDTVVKLGRAFGEYTARRIELTQLADQIEKFLREANPVTINKRVTDFERWTKLLADEMKR